MMATNIINILNGEIEVLDMEYEDYLETIAELEFAELNAESYLDILEGEELC